ncbi:aspartate aminotransferase [Niastella yeongjuensis]|uniref:Aminotransferase n=1 Tax=Niastella yeongjuensis TaxID=354355 RepID=A0A1V9ELR5_9BACT|nr:aminotransferase class I/II-fold pyridoxal phosphate-dependent enzyme [Niastella yeongjuensis]OQP46894.1 aspartate aminotransferase [Niastella yeongjuensis]SEN59231.1 Aspartate/methionine/tyrosine aminotransferase [Niastella yeongjuensis]
MLYKRMPIEKESPEERGYNSILFNLAESSVADLTLGELNIQLNELKLEYIPHRGNTQLRQMLATEAGGLHPDQVLLTNGACGALFIINTALLTSADHLIVVRPNYATNIEVPLTIGCAISYIDLQLEESWRVNLKAIEAAVTPATKLISITTPHNPTGTVMTQAELQALITLAEKKKIYLLVDETYRDTCFATPYPVVASTSEWVISVSSLSKAFGLPGLRIGWLITRNEHLMEQFLAAKEMIYISNAALDEEVATQFYRQKEKFATVINQKAMENFQVLRAWLQQEPAFEYVLPAGGVVCFPRFANPDTIDIPGFYETLVQKYKTMVGAGHWFAMPDSYMRIGFGWLGKTAFQQALEHVSAAIAENKR